MLESVEFVSWSVCACVILGAGPGRGRRLWGCVKGLLIKNSRTVPWRETYHGKNRNERLRQRKHPGGRILSYISYIYIRYLPPNRVGFLRRFGLTTSIHFAHFGLESGIDFAHFGLESGIVGSPILVWNRVWFSRELQECTERIYRFNSK